MKKIQLLFLISVLSGSITASAQIAINEVMASNSSTISDEDGDFEDWIELYNYSDQDINLSGYALSDDNNVPFKWVLPDLELKSGEYLLVWASSKNRVDPSGELHTNFAINAGGEEITLFAPDAMLVDEMEPTEIPTDISYGRYINGTGNFIFYENPTPAAANAADGFEEQLATPEFSIQPGFYANSLFLSLSHPDEDVQIYYSIDGSEPDETTTLYTEPIFLESRNNDPNVYSMIRTNPIETINAGFGWNEPSSLVEKAHVIRVIAVKDGSQDSEIETGSWFIGNNDFNLPVISLTTPMGNLFDADIGIYVPGTIYDEQGYGNNSWGIPNANYFQRGEEWERLFSLEWFEDDEQLFSQDIGVRIHGGVSRAFPMKSLRLYARNEYGQSHIEHKVFVSQDYDEYKRLILRNSGQDYYINAVLFRDAFNQSLLKDLNVQTMAYRPIIVYLNGEFWGLHNVRERYDKHFFERTYNVSEDYLDWLTYNVEIEEGSNTHYLDMLTFIEQNSLSDPSNYEELQNWMDIENYVDYVIGNVFICNYDWPGNNVDYWRYSGPPDANVKEKDGRWRWLVYDTDFGFGLNQGNGLCELNMLELITDEESNSWPNQQWATFLIRSLLENETFETYFIQRFADLMNVHFRTDKMIAMIDEMAGVIEPVMGEHIDRWGYPASISVWESNVQLMRTFAELRPQIQWEHLSEHFGLGPLIEVGIEVDGGGVKHLKLNTSNNSEGSEILNSINNNAFTAYYFEGMPIRLEAETYPGIEISHWEVNDEIVDNSILEFVLEGNTTIKAHIIFSENEFEEATPISFQLTDDESYSFDFWSADEPAETYPDNMVFVYMDEEEPGLDADIAGFTTGVYNLESRTRINGMDEQGFCFLNTGNSDGNPGYPGVQLGGAIVGLDTRGLEEVSVTWTGRTALPNSREYHLRLQYRIGDEGPFFDVNDEAGNPVEYQRNEQAGHSESIGTVQLPDVVMNKPYVQLLWRYYHTGIRFDEDSGARSQMCVSSIFIDGQPATRISPPVDRPLTTELHQNYPNPFNPSTIIPFSIEEPTHVKIAVYTISGRLVQILTDNFYATGTHQVQFDGSSLSSGVYLYTLESEKEFVARKMIFLK